MSQNNYISNNSIYNVIINLKNIRRLYLQGCKKLTDLLLDACLSLYDNMDIKHITKNTLISALENQFILDFTKFN